MSLENFRNDPAFFKKWMTYLTNVLEVSFMKRIKLPSDLYKPSNDFMNDYGKTHSFMNFLRDPRFKANISEDEVKHKMWPLVKDCLLESVYLYCEKKGWQVETNDLLVVGSAALIIALHILLGYDYLEPRVPYLTTTKEHPYSKPNSNNAEEEKKSEISINHEEENITRTVLYRENMVILSRASKGRTGEFTPKRLTEMVYKVFEATNWMGCKATERHYARLENNSENGISPLPNNEKEAEEEAYRRFSTMSLSGGRKRRGRSRRMRRTRARKPRHTRRK